jgi:hypothetical protein
MAHRLRFFFGETHVMRDDGLQWQEKIVPL